MNAETKDDVIGRLKSIEGHVRGIQRMVTDDTYCIDVIGQVQADPHHFVQMTTAFGGRRIVDWLSGEQLPRIC